MTKEQECEKEIARLSDEIAERSEELKAKGINPEEFIASRPMGKFIAAKEKPGDYDK